MSLCLLGGGYLEADWKFLTLSPLAFDVDLRQLWRQSVVWPYELRLYMEVLIVGRIHRHGETA